MSDFAAILSPKVTEQEREMRERIIALQDEIERLHKERETLLAELQQQCPHPLVVETPSEKKWFLFRLSQRTERLCMICGRREEQQKKIPGIERYFVLQRAPVKIVSRGVLAHLSSRLQPLQNTMVPDGLLVAWGD